MYLEYEYRTYLQKPHLESELNNKSSEAGEERVNKTTVPQEIVSKEANEETVKKKRKKKQANDLRFEAELEKLGVVSKRKQRKKE